MGFYGNITDTSKTHFQFDKIFSSRYKMDHACELGEDEIYSGRFVLVKYDSNENNDDKISFYDHLLIGYKNNTDDFIYADEHCQHPYVFTTFETVNNPKSSDWEKYYIKTKEGQSYIKITSSSLSASETYYQPSTASSNRLAFNDDGSLKDNLISINTIIYIKDFNSDFYICTERDNVTGNALYDFISNYSLYGEYLSNFKEDSNYYGNLFDSRGYDGTVWEKVYSNGKGRFIQIARLNGSIPNIELHEDPPTQLPSNAYIDSNSSNDLYRIKVPGSWGFRIKEAGEEELSEYTLNQSYYQYDNNLLEINNRNIRADIYFNLKDEEGNLLDHKKLKSYKDPQTYPNEILLQPTGISGKKYYDNEGNFKTQKDTYELSIHLPIIGNMISDGYDLIYGENEVKEGEEPLRPTDILWYNGNDTDDNKFYGDSNLNLGGKTHDLNTLAGTLNTFHDRLGQNIVKKDSYPSFENIQNLDPNLIYEIEADDGEKLYFYKDVWYDYEDITDDNIHYDIANNIDLETYQENTYYIRRASDSQLIIADQPYDFYQNNISYYENNNGKVIFYKKNISTSEYQGIELLQYNQDTYYYYSNGSKDYLLDHHPYTPSYPTADYYDINIVRDNETNEILAEGDILSIKTFSKAYHPNEYYEKIGETYTLISDSSLNEDIEYYEINSINAGGTSENNKKILYRKNTYYYYEDGIPQLATGEYNSSLIYYYIPLNLNETYYVQSPSGAIIVGHPLDIDHARKIPNEKIFGTSEELYAKKENSYIPSSQITNALEENQYCTIESTNITNELFVPNKYYTYDENGFHFATEYGTDSTKYYQLKPLFPLTTPFYEAGKYFYNNGNLFVIDYSIIKSNRPYYIETALYVSSDFSERFKKGYKWKNQALYVPASVTLAKRSKSYNLFPLKGINNGDASLNGSIKTANTIIANTNPDTREMGTIQGALNTIEDYLNLFQTMYPGRILYVNDFGQLTATSFTLSDLQQMQADINELKSKI